MSKSEKEMLHQLKAATQCSIVICKEAMEYANGDYSLALAYIKAKTCAIATPGLTFHERISRFYNTKNN